MRCKIYFIPPSHSSTQNITSWVGLFVMKFHHKIFAMKSNKKFFSWMKNIKILYVANHQRNRWGCSNMLCLREQKSRLNGISNEINIYFSEIFTIIMFDPLKLIIESLQEERKVNGGWGETLSGNVTLN